MLFTSASLQNYVILKADQRKCEIAEKELKVRYANIYKIKQVKIDAITVARMEIVSYKWLFLSG